MDNVFLRPARNAAGEPMHVRDPQSGRPLDPAGEWKPANQFWTRRLRDGDVEQAPLPAPGSSAAGAQTLTSESPTASEGPSPTRNV